MCLWVTEKENLKQLNKIVLFQPVEVTEDVKETHMTVKNAEKLFAVEVTYR